MPELTWIGKDAVRRHHLDVPFRPLELQYKYAAPNTKADNALHRIIHGDNLEALKSLLPEYEGRVNCIYIDPPYNTGNQTWVYNDNVKDPRLLKWLRQVVGKEGDDLSRHDKWLCMMYPRLKLLHKLLSDDGAIFVSIDDVEVSNLRLLLDEVFGPSNFIEIFSWMKTETPANLSYKSKKAVEYVLCYQKKKNTKKFVGLQKTSSSDNPLTKPQNSIKTLSFNKEHIITNFKKHERFEKGMYGTAANAIELLDDFEVINGKVSNDIRLAATFIWTQENLENELSNGTEIRIKTRTLVPSYEKKEYDPEVPWNIIDRDFGVSTNDNASAELKEIFGHKVFDYPKPPSLIAYLINFICDKNSIILDSFAGSGTTLHAVLNLNNKDKGQRECLLIEMEDYAETVTAERVRRVAQGYGDTSGTGGGFGFYTLGAALFGRPNDSDPESDDNNALDATELAPGAPSSALRQYVWYSETAQPLPVTSADAPAPDHPAYLGTGPDGTRVYLYYDPTQDTVFDRALMQSLAPDAVRYVVYADACLVSEAQRTSSRVVFKKISRDIVRF